MKQIPASSNWFWRFWLSVTLLLAPLQAQEHYFSAEMWREAGFPYVQNFGPKTYGENPQNWGIIQDERGIMYFGNTHGVLIFDGISWQLVQIANDYVVRSLCLSNGTVYVGGQNELGYLETAADGRYRYVSLIDRLPESERDFKDVWRTVASGDTIYFQATRHLFRLAGGEFRIWHSSTRFNRVAALFNRVYIGEEGTGLLEIRKDSLQLAPGGEALSDKRIYVMLPYPADTSSGAAPQLLIGTTLNGLYRYDRIQVTPFPTAIDNLLKENRLFHGASLPHGLFALGMLSGGVAVIDREGRLCQMIDAAAGLRDERVYHLAADREGALWLALNNGIARVAMPAPLTRFSADAGITSIVESVIRYRGRLYIGTHLGVYELDTANGPPAMFKPVPGYTSFAWGLVEAGGDLLAAGDQVYRIEGGRAIPIASGWVSTRTIYKSRLDPNRVYVGLTDGLAALQLENGRWQDLGRLEGVSELIFGITEDDKGNLWLGTQYAGVIKATTPAAVQDGGTRKLTAGITRYGTTQGLPELQISPAMANGKLYFATTKGIKHFDPQRERFYPDSTFGTAFADSSGYVYSLREDAKHNVWIIAGGKRYQINGRAVPQPGGGYRWEDTPFRQIYDLGEVFTIYPEPDGTVWFGGSEGLARYTPAIPKDYNLDYSAVIRRVTATRRDSLIFDGIAPVSDRPELPYRDHSLRFEFAALSYDDIGSNRYQFMLEGFDSDWSNWTNETKKDYTGLSEGDYTFRVRAQNIYHHLSGEARFDLTIRPPWYRSWWAYLLYTLAGGGLVAGLIQLRVRQLERKSHELEQLVAERTAEVVEQRNRLKLQSEKLAELDQLKSRFFANISHEFRTPLTLILGVLDKFVSRKNQPDDQKDYSIMHRNARRLLRLINQLLELSRLEAGSARLRAARRDIVTFLRRLAVSFSSMAEQKDIALTFNGTPLTAERGDPAIFAYFDSDKLEKVFYNLLSNACKFTPAGGSVRITMGVDSGAEAAGKVEIQVANSGPGIAAEKLPYIFDRFYQAEDDGGAAYEGTGIGLALVKELVALHHGTVQAESVPGTETVFRVTLPLGRAHLSDEHIIEAPVMPEADAIEPTPEAAVSEPEAAAAAPTSTDASADDEETLVLVVEDHPDLRDFIREHLAGTYTILEAENGAAGLATAEAHIPDLVISDIMMPEMNGYDLCAALKSNVKTSHIPVILLTAKAGTEDKLEGLETGADDYLVKPFDPRELKTRVANLIRLRAQLREKFSTEMLLKPGKVSVPSTQQVFLERLKEITEAHLAEEDFNVEMLGRELGMSRAQVHRKLKAISGQSASEFIRTFRLQRAAELLLQDAGNIAEIAYMVGFNSQAYFTRSFQELFGCSPREYRKQQ